MPKLVSISLATNWLRQKVLKIPLADSCLNSKYCVFPIDTSSQRQTDMRDLLLAISVEFPASDGRFLKIIDSRNGATLLHSSTSINAFLSGRTSVSTPNSSIIYKVDQESVADLKRLAIKNLNDATIELSALDLIETRIRNCAQWRLYLARWGLLGYLTTELGVIVFLTYELGWDFLEPVTCLLGYFTTLLGFGYGVLRHQQFTLPNYESWIKNRTYTRLCKERNFNVPAYLASKDCAKTWEMEVALLNEVLEGPPK